jgi:hypothetical protein
MDISSLAVSMEAAAYQLRHLTTGEPVVDPKTKEPVVFFLYCVDHPKVDEADFAAARQRLNAAISEAAAKAAERNGKKGKKAVEPVQVEISKDDADAEKLESLLAMVAGWQNIDMDGKPFPYSPENARKFLTDPRFKWIRRQIARFAENLENFLPPSPTT